MRKPFRRKTTKARAKSIKLNQKFWLRNASDISFYRDVKLLEQGGKCAITGIVPDNPCLDHAHASNGFGKEGACRGVLDSQVNLLEGRYLQLFKKAGLDRKYNLDFPSFLINMGEYLQQDNSKAPLHKEYMESFRKKVKRWKKDHLLLRLYTDYGIEANPKLLVSDLVQMYIQKWVDNIEEFVL